MLVAFRTDASIQIGTGHVMRCLTLADEFARQGHKCHFICRQHPAHLADLIISKGHELSLLPHPEETSSQQCETSTEGYENWLNVSWEEDAHQTLNAISAQRPAWLVVDHYGLDLRWESLLSGAVNKIMVIDDLANRAHACNLLLDQNLGRTASEYDGLLPIDCQLLIGPTYALLRPEFAELRNQSLSRRIDPKLNRILISLGGVDLPNMTGRILRALALTPLPPETEVEIIMGAFAPHLNEVKAQAAQLPFMTKIEVNVDDMANKMCLADLFIGAAGSTSWERCCMGIPAITVIIAENQRAIAEALSKVEAGILINCKKLEEELIALFKMLSLDAKIQRNQSRNAAQVCDGSGANYVVKSLLGTTN